MKTENQRIVPIRLIYNSETMDCFNEEFIESKIIKGAKEKKLKSANSEILYPAIKKNDYSFYYKANADFVYLLFDEKDFYGQETCELLSCFQKKSNILYNFNENEGISHEISTDFIYKRTGFSFINSRIYRSNIISKIEKFCDTKKYFFKRKIKNYCYCDKHSDIEKYKCQDINFHPLFMFYVNIKKDDINYYDLLNEQYKRIYKIVFSEEKETDLDCSELIFCENLNTKNFIYWENMILIQDFQKIISFFKKGENIDFYSDSILKNNIIRLINDFIDHYLHLDIEKRSNMVIHCKNILRTLDEKTYLLREDMIDRLIENKDTELLSFILESNQYKERYEDINICIQKQFLNNVISENTRMNRRTRL